MDPMIPGPQQLLYPTEPDQPIATKGQYENQSEQAYSENNPIRSDQPIATNGQIGVQNIESVIEQIAVPPNFFIEQKIKAAELLSSVQTQNEFDVWIQGQNGRQEMMQVKEKTEGCSLQCGRACGSKFEFKIGNDVVMEMERDSCCICCFCNLINSEFKVKYVDGNEMKDLSTFKSSSCVFNHCVKIKSSSLNEPLYAKSSFGEMIEKTFKIKLDDSDVIEIKKVVENSEDIAREIWTNADKFKITLPKNLHEFLNSGQRLQTDKKKFELVLIVISLTIAINQLYLENRQANRHNRPHQPIDF